MVLHPDGFAHPLTIEPLVTDLEFFPELPQLLERDVFSFGVANTMPVEHLSRDNIDQYSIPIDFGAKYVVVHVLSDSRPSVSRPCWVGRYHSLHTNIKCSGLNPVWTYLSFSSDQILTP